MIAEFSFLSHLMFFDAKIIIYIKNIGLIILNQHTLGPILLFKSSFIIKLLIICCIAVLEVAVLFFLSLTQQILSRRASPIAAREELPSVCFLWGRPVCPLCLCRRQLAAVYFNQHCVCQRAAAFSLLEMAVLVFSFVVQVGHDSRNSPRLFPVGRSNVGTNLNIQKF